MPELRLKEREQESRRIDYAALSYQVGSRRKLQNAFDGVVDVVENLCGGFGLEDTGKPTAFYNRLFINDLGVRIELTEPETGLRNQGLMLVTLPGKVFYLQSSTEQAWMVHRLTKLKAFRHFSRLDLQNTELEPEHDADRVFQGVQKGLYWVKGYGSWRIGHDVDADGLAPNGVTVYWGSRRSERQGRTYDKAKESGWKVPAIRDELQLRGEWAKAYGQELVRGLAGCHTTDDMASSVGSLVVSGLNNHLQYWKLNGTNPKTDKNWQRKAEVADWFTARVGRHQEPIRKPQRAESDLDSVVSYGVRQYGRSFGLWMARYAEAHECSLADAAYVLGQRFLGRLDPMDVPFAGLVGECKDMEAIGSENLWGIENEGEPRN